MRPNVNSPNPWCSTFSSRLRRHSRRWTKLCESSTIHVQASLPSELPFPLCDHQLTIVLLFHCREEKNLSELSSLGHFLKGSSATLGFNKVRDSCQIIQQYGHKQTVDGTDEPDEEVCLKKIKAAVEAVKVDFVDLEKELKAFFDGDSASTADTAEKTEEA